MTVNDRPTGARRQNAIPSGVSGGFFVYNALGDKEICFADENVIRLYGCESMDEFRAHTGNSFRGMVHPEDWERVERGIQTQTFSSSKRHDYVRYRILTRQGACRYVEDFGHVLYGDDGAIYYYVFIVDVDRAEYENQDQNSFAEAHVFLDNKKADRLTGFLNMEAFYDSMKETPPERALEGEPPSSVVVFDILGLRDINRSVGHAEGDARILALADTVQKNMPRESQFYRGYEAELIVVCPRRSEQSLMDDIMAVVHACKSPVLFGVGSTGHDAPSPSYAEAGTLLQAFEEAQLDLRVKKMLNAKSNQSQSLTSLVRALEEVDAETEAHVQRTQKMGISLGRRVGLSDSQLTLLQLLCLLHDIGKIAVPLEILNKPGKLNHEEWAVLRSHAEKGYQIAVATDELKPLADVILHHHERWDGRGYPTGLVKEEIPILSRIIAIVDAYDAMVNDRCYRKAMSPDKAKKEIRDNAGTQFDPYLAAEFLTLLEENPSLSIGVKTGGGEVRVFDRAVSESTRTGQTKPVAYSKYQLNLDETIIEVDDSFETMTGYSPGEVIGRMTQFDLIPEEEREYYIAQVQRQFVRGDIAYLRHPLRRRDGSVIQVICNGERYFDSSVRAFRSTIMMFEID